MPLPLAGQDPGTLDLCIRGWVVSRMKGPADVDNLTNMPKKIVYLDQFVISNITKILDPDFPRRAHLLEKQPFWLDLYKRLDRLLKLQLIVCPDSHYHRTESLLSGDPDFDSLQDVYSHLSNDCTFHDATMILRWQLLHYFRDYLEGHPEREPIIPVSDVVHGDLNKWNDRFRVTVPYRTDANEVASLRSQREKLYGTVEEIFKKWQQDRTSFKLSVQEEAQALGHGLLEVFASYLTKWMAYSFRLETPQSPLELLPPSSVILVLGMFDILAEYKVSDPMEQLQKVGDYLRSPHFLRLPFVRVSSMLYAAVARKASSMKSPPNRGATTDVTVIASVLPYCHAMFVDNEMAGYLRERPLRDEVARFGTRIFSPTSKASFLAYLDEIEATAEERHLKWVKATYPSRWFTEPFMNVVVHGKKRRGQIDGMK
jgi:hypothetical protein